MMKFILTSKPVKSMCYLNKNKDCVTFLTTVKYKIKALFLSIRFICIATWLISSQPVITGSGLPYKRRLSSNDAS